jgi:hypothetical protein
MLPLWRQTVVGDVAGELKRAGAHSALANQDPRKQTMRGHGEQLLLLARRSSDAVPTLGDIAVVLG